MALGLNYGSSGVEFTPFIKFDARAGRVFRTDREQDSSGQYNSEAIDITSNFKAVMDLANLEVGWMRFAAGAAPEYALVPLGKPLPPRPGDDWRQGTRIMLKLHQSCGGDVRSISGNAAAFLRGIDDLHTAYLNEVSKNQGKLPIVVLEKTTPVVTGQGERKSTNYQPQFKIVGWAARPTDLPEPEDARILPAPGAPAAAPATGSTRVEAPKAKPAKASVGNDPVMAGEDDFG